MKESWDEWKRRYLRVRRNLKRLTDCLEILLIDKDEGEDVEDDIEAAREEIAALTNELNRIEGERNQNENA